MSRTPNYDAKARSVLDALQPGERICALTGEKWTMDEAEIGWYRKFNVPPSPYAPLTRWYLLAGTALGFEWWWNAHAETGKPVLTYIHPASGVRVLPDAEWHQKDFAEKGTAFDEARPFFEQLLALRQRVPLPATLNVKEPQNSIAVISQGETNSYFTIGCQGKNSFYSSDGLDMESSSEIYGVQHVADSYQAIYGERVHNCRAVSHSYDCANSSFLFDCRNCEDCFGGTNLRNRRHVFFNRQLTPEAYAERMRDIDLSRRSVFGAYRRKFEELMAADAYWPENFNEKSPDSTGEYLRDCVECRNCFNSFGGPRNNAWCAWAYGKAEGNYFSLGAIDASDAYSCVAAMECRGARFCLNMNRSRNVEYCVNCLNCEDCFGCVGLNRKKFHIFNRPYAEEDYWRELDRLKCLLLKRGEYGLPFPQAFSTSYFFESVAGQNLAATEADRVKYGFPIFDPESCGAVGKLAETAAARPSAEVPDAIDDLDPAAWAGVPLLDQACGRRFAFLRPELEFYRARRIAPPVEHFITRVKRLYQTANVFLMEDAACAKCGAALRVAKNVTYKNRRHLCRACYLRFLEENG
ncbi:hypothetical protein HY734_01105 [Candidatus Uhrbacteria bacterium]|nr:hypothetical protein [Candidatus Uhrbacteria bacterium]